MAQVTPFLSRDSHLIKKQMVSSTGREYLLDETDIKPQAPGEKLKLHAFAFIYGQNTTHWTYPGYSNVPVKLSDRSFWYIYSKLSVDTGYTKEQLAQLFPNDFNADGTPTFPRDRDGPGVNKLIKFGPGEGANLVGVKTESANKKPELWQYLALSEVLGLRAKIETLEQSLAEIGRKNASSMVHEVLADLQKALDKCHENEKAEEARKENEANLRSEIATLKAENDKLKEENNELEKENEKLDKESEDLSGNIFDLTVERDNLRDESRDLKIELEVKEEEALSTMRLIKSKADESILAMETACRKAVGSYSLQTVDILTDAEIKAETKKRESELKQEGSGTKKAKVSD